MRSRFYISALVFVLCIDFMAYARSTKGNPVSSQTADHQTEMVVLDVANGATAFMIDKKAYEAWWVVGECRYELPLKSGNHKSNDRQNSQVNSMISEVFSKNVRMGTRQVELRQQFRFNMATHPVTLEVFNSVRGGWSLVPVRVNQTCTQDSTCRRRMESERC